MGTRSIAPMCILVKDHSRVLCEQLQQLRLQTGLVDLDIVCEDHHINVHKVVMAACSKFFKDQLCKQNVQVPVILRLEDFGLELKRDAVSYIIEFVYRGEVNIPGERLTEVCQAAHTLGVVGLEHLPVPAGPQRPPLLTKEHLQIADESELRGDVNMYNPFHAVNSSPQTSMGKFGMDINNINMNPFFPMNNNAMQNDDIILLQTTEDHSRSIHNNDPDIIPISFGETTVSHDVSNQRLYHNPIQNDKINLIVSEGGQASEQYRIIPEILSDGTFHEETIDSCLSLFPNHNSSEPQDLSPVKTQESMSKLTPNNTQRQGKNISNSQQHQPNELSMAITGNQTTFQALFEAASNELVVHNEVSKSGSSNIVFTTPSTSVNTICSTPTRPPSVVSQKPLPQIKPADCAIVDSKQATKDLNKNTSPGKSLSQGKLRVINQGIQSENIQSPSLAESRNKARRRSGQVLPSQLAHPHLPGQVAHIPAQLPHIPGQVALSSGQVAPVGSGPVSIPPNLNNIPVPSVASAVPVRSNGVRLLSVGPNEGTPDSDQGQIIDQDSESESEVESDPPPVNTGLATPGLVPWNSEEIWPNKSWTHPVESVDTSVPTSGAVWQLPATQAKSNTTQWNINTQLETSLSRNLGLQEPDLSIIPPSIATRGHPTIPWNTPVTNDNSRDGKWENIPVTTASNVAGGSRDTPPNVSVSWTQPQTSACPSPVLPPGNILPGQPVPQVGPEVELTSSSTSPSLEEVESTETVVDQMAQIPGPSWRNTFGSDDNMLAIRSGIPLALQNKAIRSGVPIGPFQNKRKRKSRSSQDGAKSKKRMSVGGKKGDLEVRKDLTIESQKNNEDLAIENVFQNDESSPSTSNIVSKTKEETSISLEKNEIIGVSSPIGGVHIKTVKKLNSDAVADLELDPNSDLSSSDLGESSKADKYPFSCVNCSMLFSSSGQLKRHTQNAHGKEETLFCQVCPEKCHGKENLKLHLYKTHGIGEMFRCEECNYESPVKAVYIKHLSEHIPQEAKKKKCPKCDKVFKTKTGLNMHLKQHFDESLFSCLVCDFKTPQKLNLVKHTASKHGQDVEGRLLALSFSCELCDFKCIAEHMLKNHVLRKHTQKSAMRFHCTNCNYATVEKAALDKHMRFKHTNERPFMCDTCGFSTHTASAMARHKRSHSNTKPHKCEVCGHEYADKKRLRDHMYIHSDHKPFKCELCNYTCRRKDNLTAHLKKQHDTVSKLEKYELVAIPDSTSNSGEWTHTDLLSVTNSSQSLSLPPPDLEPPKPVWETDLCKSGYIEKYRPHSSMSTCSDKPRPQSSMSGYSDKPRATSSPISSCGSLPGPTPPSLPTIAMADIAVPYSHPTTDYTSTQPMSHYITTQSDMPGSTHYTQDISWTVDTCHTDHEEVIFVPQDTQHNSSNWGPFINYVNMQYDHGMF